MNDFVSKTLPSPVRLEKQLSLMTAGEMMWSNQRYSRADFRAAATTTTPALGLNYSSSPVSSSRHPKRKRVRFSEHNAISSVILVESRHELSQCEKNSMWVTKSEFLSTLRDVSQSIEECFSACSQVESATYTQALSGSYMLCCNVPNSCDHRGGDDNDEASVVQLGLPLARILAQGGMTAEEEIRDNDLCGILASTPSPLQLLRGLERQILPQLANERSRRRLEHVSSLVQLQQLVRETPDGDAMICAIARRLSQPSRRFAALMGAADAFSVSSGEKDYFGKQLQKEPEEPLVLDDLETSARYLLTPSFDNDYDDEPRTRKRSADDLEFNGALYNSDEEKKTSPLLANILPSLPGRKQQKRSVVPPLA